MRLSMMTALRLSVQSRKYRTALGDDDRMAERLAADCKALAEEIKA
jgi:hypothetical protein